VGAEARIAFLNRVLHGTVNSVVQYLEVATPYVPPDGKAHLETIRKIRDEQTLQAHELTELIQGLDAVPSVGAFPYWNVDLNYLDLRFLAGFAARHEEALLGEMERGLDALRQDGHAFTTVQRMLEAKRRHVATLKEIAKRPEKPKPAPPPPAQPAAPKQGEGGGGGKPPPAPKPA